MRANLNEIVKLVNAFKDKTAFFEKEHFMKYCKDNRIPYVLMLFYTLKKRNIILKTKETKRYFFAMPQPIYIGVIESVYSEIQKSYAKPKSEKEKTESNDVQSFGIEEAISLLKENGYLVYKSV